jgi:hypothetical protein
LAAPIQTAEKTSRFDDDATAAAIARHGNPKGQGAPAPSNPSVKNRKNNNLRLFLMNLLRFSSVGN